MLKKRHDDYFSEGIPWAGTFVWKIGLNALHKASRWVRRREKSLAISWINFADLLPETELLLDQGESIGAGCGSPTSPG